MEEKGMFRSALGGFNKADVLNYIDALTAAWNEERVALEQQAKADREAAETATARAAELEAAHEAMTAELDEIRPLAEQTKEATEQLAQMRTELDEALAQNAQFTQQLAQSEEKIQSARAEMMAAEERLCTREAELTRRNERLAALEATVARYEAVLGRSDSMKEHVDGIVRPFTEKANRHAEDALDNAYALVANLLAQLGEMQGSIEEQKSALRQAKADNDAKLSATLGSWFSKIKDLAGGSGHFFP